MATVAIPASDVPVPATTSSYAAVALAHSPALAKVFSASSRRSIADHVGPEEPGANV